MDIVDQSTRSRMMSGIRARDTEPELFLRRLLHGMGFRFRLHVSTLPGKPDIVLPRYRVVILVHGCFWHGHDCPAFKWPKSNTDFWRRKIEGNRARDLVVQAMLAKLGWRVIVIWECEIRSAIRSKEPDLISSRIAALITGEQE